ncbi:hypothetical protein BC939DRAFT_526791 [Gamsiella multidivaricata]|uniref:uncharacterized protein n=1 Tax=Gamsiella multidivaricata TaxID=101098 RepID=UPI00221E8F98|nr:uncharacterized protein BC939DRAFT_526791 [Gamsiella multidivaricata]KAI7828157.1 hypothetical protein BC939DRAFT_526791 [Gamsiella multidivaricata]
MPAANRTVEEFRNKFVCELERRWNSQHIPDAVLIATFMNSADTNHAIFSNMVQRENESVSLRGYAESQILKMLHSMVKNGFRFDDAMAMGARGDDTDTQYWTRRFNDELKRYDIDVKEVPCDTYRTEPHVWWRHRVNAFPYLPSIARVSLSVQASLKPEFLHLAG